VVPRFAESLVAPRVAWTIVGLLTLFYAALCVQGIDGLSLWNDEAFSFFVAWRGLGHTLAMMRQDSQPPAYYLVLAEWLRLGHGVAVLRGLSAFASVLAVPLAFAAARRLLGVRLALLAVLLFVIGPESVAWAQKARPYAVQAFFVAVAFWGFACIWTASRPRFGLPWVAYVLGGGLAVLAQYPGVFFLIGCNAAVAVRVARDWRAERRFARAWGLGQAALLLVWLPWLPDGVPQVLGHLTPAAIATRHANYLAVASPQWLAGTLSSMLSIASLWRALPPFEVLYAVLAVLGLVVLWRRPEGRGLPVIGTVVVPLAVCVLLWSLLHPVFGYIIYTFIWLRLPYAMLIAAGLAALRPRWLAAGVLALLLLGNAWGLANYKATPNVPLDRVTARIAADLRPGDGVLLSDKGAARWALAYYLGPPYAGRLVGLDVSDYPNEGSTIATRAEALKVPRLWVVLPGTEKLPFDPAALAPAMRRTVQEHVADVLVERYDRAAP